MRCLRALIVLCVVWVVGPSAAAQIDDVSSGRHGASVSAPVRTSAVGADGAVYVAGSFTSAGGAAAGGIARWDGEGWSSLDGGLASGIVFALATGADGSLYAAGQFASIGGVEASNIARWDGTAWRPLGAGLSGPAYALCVAADGSLLVGGGFARAGGLDVPRLARWDGTAWQAVVAPGTVVPWGSLSVIAAGGDGAIYLSGMPPSGVTESVFRYADGSVTTFPALGEVSSLAVGTDGTLYAGGYLPGPVSPRSYGVLRWSGTAWQPLGSGLPVAYFDQIRAMVVDAAGGLVVARSTSISSAVPYRYDLWRWDGAWTALPARTDQPVYSLSLAPDGRIVAAGAFTTIGGVAATRVALWDGSAWRRTGSAVNGTVRSIAFGPDATYAAGAFTVAGDTLAAGVARRVGETWLPLGTNLRGADHLVAGPGGRVVATGQLPTGVGSAPSGVVEWDGSAWRLLGADLQGPGRYISALAFGPDGSLYAGGEFTDLGDGPAAHVARWDGTAWRALGDGTDQAVVALVALPDGSLVAGGRFDTAGGLPAPGIARWNGAAWSPLPSPGLSSVWALAHVSGESIVAFGPTADGFRVMLFDGTSWHPQGGPWPIGASLYDVAAGPDGAIYVGGDFADGPDGAVSNVARWDGTAWQPIGAGADRRVFALAPTASGSIYVGGEFSSVAGVASPFVARIAAPPVATDAPPLAGETRLRLLPNPTRGHTMVWLDATGPATVVLYDALGRRAAFVFDGVLHGSTAMPLPAGLAPGLYIVRLIAGGSVTSARLVVSR